MIINTSSIIILLFLTIILGFKLEIPQISQIKEKIYIFNDIFEKYNNGEIYFITVLPYILTSIIMALTVLISIYITKKKEDPILLIVLLAGYLTQGVMVMAPYSPLRTTLTPIIFFCIGIVYLTIVGTEEDFSIVIPFLIAFTIQNINSGILLLILYVGIKGLKLENLKISKELLPILLIFSLIAITNWYQVYAGYRENKKIYNENIRRIELFINSNPTQGEQENKELHLLLPKDERYGFTAMVGIDWVDEAIKEYFNINKTVELVGDINQINK